jgi:hypothetical protein
MKNLTIIFTSLALSLTLAQADFRASTSPSTAIEVSNSDNQYVLEMSGIGDSECKLKVREAFSTLEGVNMILIEKGSTPGQHKVSFKSPSAKITQVDAEKTLQGEGGRYKILAFAKQ